MADRDPYIYRIKEIHKVVDGDTIDASIDLGFDISLEKRIRLADSTEKYGRIIGHLYINSEATSLNEQMIDAGYALAYDGGTKDKNFSVLLEKRKTK